MKCGLRSKAAGVNSREFDDMEIIITKGALAPQYESAGYDTLGWNSLLVFPLQAAAKWILPPIDQWKTEPMAVYEASSGVDILNTGQVPSGCLESPPTQ